jgi:uncharacterized OsmC-like protein
MPPQSVVTERHRALRNRYRDHPEDALASKWARTTSLTAGADDPFHGEVQLGTGFRSTIRFGLDAHVGGLDDFPNPGDLLCAALAACSDGAIRMVANRLGVVLEELSVEVSGQIDSRGALMIDPAARVGFERLDCTIHLRPEAGSDPALVARLLDIAERSCVNLDTLRRGVQVHVGAEHLARNSAQP